MRRLVTFATLLGVAAVFSCSRGSDEPAPLPPVIPHVFVGHVTGSNALVAIVESDEAVVAYTCGVGGELATHTGWYFGVRDPSRGSAVELVNGPSGLRLRADVGVGGGTGVLTLADAREVPFTVEPARGEAGLYDYEDQANLVGFIRANDGAVAGSATVRSGAGVATTTPTAPTTSPVTPAPAPAPSPTPPTGTSPRPPQPDIPVLFDNGGIPRLVAVTPIVSAERRVIKRGGPVVVFFMHGMADNLGLASPGSNDDVTECAGPKDSPFYGRCEWGQDFLPGVFGSANVEAQLSTLDNRDVTGDKFLRDVANVAAPHQDFGFDESQGRAMSGDCATDPSSEERHDPKIARHFIVPGPLRPASLPALAPIRTPVPPPLSAFVTWRDPTRSLVFSGRRVTRQIYAALRWYEATYRVTPGVILVGQSFGGLVSRFILSRPDPQTIPPDLNRERVALCREDLAKMEYIRDRTLYLVTLATPHEGSQLAEWGPPVKSALRDLGVELRQGLATSTVAKVLRGMDSIATLLQRPTTPSLVEAAIDTIDGLLPQLESASALTDLTLARMAAFNRGPLAPDRARRSAATPIVGAARTLVPVYATLGRSPGSDVFDSPNVLAGFERLPTKRVKARGWVVQTMLVADVLTRQFQPRGWGDATVAPYAEFRSILDRRERLFDASATTTQLEAKLGRDIQSVLRTASPWLLGRFGRDTDAVLSALQGEVTVALPHVMLPIHTDQKWRIGFDGSTLEVPMPAFQCGTKQIVLDLDALARLLVEKFRRTPDVLAAIAGKDLRGVLEALAVVVQESDTFARETARWFVGKVGELAPLPAECDARPDNPFDVFSLAELGNWKVVAATGRIPKPAFIPTGERASDGEMDSDGAVHSASALGFTLARQPFFFEHDRADDAGRLGSWYRLYDNPVAERRHHGLQYENDVGRWLRSAFLVPQVGPVPARDTFSTWVE